MAELLLDSDIRLWVFLPIVVITFLVGIIRHYVTILLSTEKKVELQQISDRYIFAYKPSAHTCIHTYIHNGYIEWPNVIDKLPNHCRDRV